MESAPKSWRGFSLLFVPRVAKDRCNLIETVSTNQQDGVNICLNYPIIFNTRAIAS